MENSKNDFSNVKKSKKFNFKEKKNNIKNSLNDVECFLRNFSNIRKYLKIYDLFK